MLKKFSDNDDDDQRVLLLCIFMRKHKFSPIACQEKEINL